MKFKISTQLSPVSRTASEIIDFIDIAETLSEDEFVAAISKLQQRFEGARIGDSGSLSVPGYEVVVIRVSELSEAEAAAITKQDIEARRHSSGYTYGEWELLSKGGPGRTDWTRGTRHAETASVYALPILDANNSEVDSLITEGGMGTDEVKRSTARQMFKVWIETKLYADDPEKLLELFWDDDYPYTAILHRQECLPHLSRSRKRHLTKLDADGGFKWDIEGIPSEIPFEICEGCEPPVPIEDDADDVAF